MDRYRSVTKRDLVCVQKGRFRLEKIEKKYIFAVGDLMQKGRKGDKIFSDESVHRGFYSCYAKASE